MKSGDFLTRDFAGGAPESTTAIALFDPIAPPALTRSPETAPAPLVTTTKTVQIPAAPVSIRLCLAASLRNRWVLYLGRRDQFQHDPSEEAVHELRVATRRLIAQLDMFATVVSSSAAEKARRALKRALKPLGRLRDIQVQKLFISEHLDEFPELTLLNEHLQRREHARLVDAAANIAALKVHKFEKWISVMFQDLADKTANAHQETRLSAAVVHALHQAHASVIRRRRAIRADKPETIHTTRVAFKKFRYMVEALSPGFTGFDDQQLSVLAAYQRRMGAIQDLEIIRASLNGFISKYGAAEEFMHPFVRRMHRLRTQALASFLKHAHEIHQIRLPDPIRAHGKAP